MQATEMDQTSQFSPYDALRPMRCKHEFQGTPCDGRAGDINWSRPGTHSFRCKKCRSYNVVHVTEAAHP